MPCGASNSTAIESGWLVVEVPDQGEQRPGYDDALSEMFMPAGSLSLWDALYRPRK